MNTARHIYQESLDSLTQAMLSGDSAGFAELVSIPYEIRTVDGLVVCKTTADVVTAVKSYVAQLKDWNVSDYVRVCDTAKFVTRDHISGYHTTRVKAGKDEVISPFLTRLSLHRTKTDRWKASVSDTSLRAADWKLIPDWLIQQDGFFQKSEASAEEQRLYLFQTILDRISDAFVSGDVEGWLRSTSLPFHMITRQGVEVFETEEAVRKDFEVYRREFEIHGVTDIFREAKTAELIDGDQMTGTYRTHIMRGANHIVPPWDASMTLRLENGLWRVTTVMRAIGHLNWSAINPDDIEDIPKHMTHDTPKKGDHQ